MSFNSLRNTASSTIARVGVLASLMGMILLACSCSNENFNHLPTEIQQFIDRYFPGQGVAGFNEIGGVYSVNLDHSASLVFNPALKWTTVEGNGSPLPQQFVYDEFPAPLYSYIVTTDNLNEVYAVTRQSGIFTVSFHNYIIDYNVATEEITPVDGISSTTAK